jgi:hypothetical protein
VQRHPARSPPPGRLPALGSGRWQGGAHGFPGRFRIHGAAPDALSQTEVLFLAASGHLQAGNRERLRHAFVLSFAGQQRIKSLVFPGGIGTICMIWRSLRRRGPLDEQAQPIEIFLPATSVEVLHGLVSVRRQFIPDHQCLGERSRGPCRITRCVFRGGQAIQCPSRLRTFRVQSLEDFQGFAIAFQSLRMGLGTLGHVGIREAHQVCAVLGALLAELSFGTLKQRCDLLGRHAETALRQRLRRLPRKWFFFHGACRLRRSRFRP